MDLNGIEVRTRYTQLKQKGEKKHILKKNNNAWQQQQKEQ